MITEAEVRALEDEIFDLRKRLGIGPDDDNLSAAFKDDNICGELLAALKEMLASHSMENIGIDASLRRTNAKKAARAVIAKVEGKS